MSKVNKKTFRTSLFGGFIKKDVVRYTEMISKEYDFKLSKKDNEIAALKTKNSELELQVLELTNKLKELLNSKNEISKVLLEAKQQAAAIVEEADKEAENKKEAINDCIKIELDKLNEIRNDLQIVSSDVFNALKHCEAKIKELKID